MKRILLASALTIAALSAHAAVGVSINVGEPGFYGRIDIGDYPPPVVVYEQPILVRHIAVPPPPIYLRVPPGHARHWSRYCARYNACGVPVYFVQDRWYNDVYVPRYRDRHEYEHDNDRGPRGHGDHGHEGRDHGDHGHSDRGRGDR